MKKIVFGIISILITASSFAQTQYDYYDDDVAYKSHNGSGDFFTGLIVIVIIAFVVWIFNAIVKDFKRTKELREKYNDSKKTSPSANASSQSYSDINKKSDTQIFNELVEQAQQGDADAQFKVGYYYYLGKVVKRDVSEAEKWFRKAAEQNQAKAQRCLGELYYRGLYNEQNFSEAVKWFTQAAEQGDADAQDYLGVCYSNGEGIEQNQAEGLKWIKKSAEQDCAQAQFH